MENIKTLKSGVGGERRMTSTIKVWWIKKLLNLIKKIAVIFRAFWSRGSFSHQKCLMLTRDLIRDNTIHLQMNSDFSVELAVSALAWSSQKLTFNVHLPIKFSSRCAQQIVYLCRSPRTSHKHTRWQRSNSSPRQNHRGSLWRKIYSSLSRKCT